MKFRFVLRRLLVTVPMVLIVITLTWALIRLAPGNFYASERKLPPAVEKNIRAKYGLDEPWYKQYGRVMRNILSLDFGNSLKYETETVNDILKRTLPVSAAVGTCAYLLALLVGTTLGTIAALKQNSKLDYAAMGLSMLGISMPNFVLGPILVLIFSLSLYWLPPARWGGFPSRNMLLSGNAYFRWKEFVPPGMPNARKGQLAPGDRDTEPLPAAREGAVHQLRGDEGDDDVGAGRDPIPGLDGCCGELDSRHGV